MNSQTVKLRQTMGAAACCPDNRIASSLMGRLAGPIEFRGKGTSLSAADHQSQFTKVEGLTTESGGVAPINSLSIVADLTSAERLLSGARAWSPPD